MSDAKAGPRPPEKAGPLTGLEQGFEVFLALARLLVLIPVVVLVLAAVAAFGYAVVVFFTSLPGLYEHPQALGHNLVLFVFEIDLFLIGATLVIAAFGFYELFISKIDPGIGGRLPGWLEMRDLNDLKARVTSMLILVAAVTFVEAILAGKPGTGVLYLGIAVALVVAALTAFLRFGRSERGGGES
jgi:uncharacterized membrane protein YqhA